MTFVLAVALASLFPKDLPEPERIRRLSRYFDPPPGSELTLDPRELRDLSKTSKPERLKGHVKVRPPKGTCFLIKPAIREQVEVCEPTSVLFFLSDIEKSGRLEWKIITGPGDFGTRLEWTTPYRVAYVTPITAEANASPDARFITKCRAGTDGNGDRRIAVELLGKEKWVITFPDRDDLLPQPPPPGNLYVSGGLGDKVSVSEAADANPDGKAAKRVSVDSDEDRAIWHIPMLRSYEMSVDHFLAGGDVTPGLSGKCRYRFEGSEQEPDVGRIECHGGTTYRFMYAPLTCMKDLGPPRG